MNKCRQCGQEYEAKRATSKYCGPKCRKLAFQPDGKISVPDLSVPAANRTLTDACGNVHQIDFDGRRKDCDLLKSWSEGKGTPYQKRLGTLARQYSCIKGYVKDGKLTAQGCRYLDVA